MPLPAKIHMVTQANAHTFTQLHTYTKIFLTNKSIINLLWLTVTELQNIIGLLIWGVTVRTCYLWEYQEGENACHGSQKMISTGTVSPSFNDLSLFRGHHLFKIPLPPHNFIGLWLFQYTVLWCSIEDSSFIVLTQDRDKEMGIFPGGLKLTNLPLQYICFNQYIVAIN